MFSATQRSALLFLAQTIVLGLALAYVWNHVMHRTSGPSVVSATPTRAYGAATSFASAVGTASHSVVSIAADRVVNNGQLFGADEQVMQRFFGSSPMNAPQQRLEASRGSGVIVSSDGLILTNRHVISGFNDIRVILWDNRAAQATVVGSDAYTDLAVLKIDAQNLPAAQFAAADSVHVGDVVLAIGNSYNLGQSVTMGIVSATQRKDLHLSLLEDFIQTDAAINEGNSGGALINVDGQLIGISTAYLSGRAGESAGIPQGIGFAIPIDLANQVLADIREYGAVQRGWIGAEFAQGIGRDPSNGGARRMVGVLQSYPDSGAAKAGIGAGDILLTFDGASIVSIEQLLKREAERKPGDHVKLEGLRGGVPFSADVTLGTKPREP
jgi:S1-C subfamily serine protease